jgi:hypothetical protein
MTTNLVAPAVGAARKTGNTGSTPDGPGAATGLEKMMTSTRARTGRRLGRLAAVGAVALLAVTAGPPAEERPQADAAVRAKGSITPITITVKNDKPSPKII